MTRFGLNISYGLFRDMKRENMENYNVSVEKLGQLRVFDEQGQKSALCDLWATQPAALVLVRHFG